MKYNTIQFKEKIKINKKQKIEIKALYRERKRRILN